MHAEVKIVVAQYGQSLIDVAVQHCGSLDAVYTILNHNRNILTGLTDELVPGTMLSIPLPPQRHPAPRHRGSTPTAGENTIQLIRYAALWQRLPSAFWRLTTMSSSRVFV